MDSPLDEQYLSWLYSKVSSIRMRGKQRTFWCLFRQLYETEFVWFVANDDNRVEDGRELRDEFLHDLNVRGVDQEWLQRPCSMFELIMGLASRLSFMTNQIPHDWFWELLGNLNLRRCTDAWFEENDEQEVGDILRDLIWRTYQPDGRGGLFPLQYPDQDQRKVEIWYQLNTYILDRV